MKITEFSLRNPLVVAALTGAVIVFGFAAYLSMGIAMLVGLVGKTPSCSSITRTSCASAA